MRLENLVEFQVGSPQFRIKESAADAATTYKFYSQNDLEEDLTGVELATEEAKQIVTIDEVTTVTPGDLVFSLISGRATIIRKEHDGYLYTQNYVVIEPRTDIDSKYLVYLLNEDREVAHQFWLGLQGSMVMKYTVKQLRELKIKQLPNLDKQQAIGDIYFKQMRIQALRKRIAENETLLTLAVLAEEKQKWTN
ncbi:restriction endonuclease subunit S [Ligilactobacillus saerimneri]|uniref:Type I restriction modification DNA specificity domain-containing protein n=1 Tax=Ligilactobacillus saerimneri 30a TaxID=1227363 RepID=M5J6U1_9LACO|nr:restriction endonuclease subunit S [Ligilactobacillus saerimneri]EKW99032.1 hypothetical protein D271_04514 [Ligilactobacillus saerimneri 30a]